MANSHEGPTRAARQLPRLDQENRFFWTAGAEGRLLICRCGDCGVYLHPPRPRCSGCASANVAPAPVSGRGRVAAYTVNEQSWIPGLAVPFVFAAVELEEQAELYVFTNIVNCPVEAVGAAMAVEVIFEHLDDVFLPLFQPRQAAQ